MSIKHILLDMDGVLVAWDEAVKSLFKKEHVVITDWGTEKFLDVSEEEMWAAIDAEGWEFWANLDRYPWYGKLMSLVQGYPWTLSSTPSKHPNSAHGKRVWIAENLGWDFTNYMLGKQKFLMAKPGVVLIDDSDKNVRQFRESGGDAILFPQPWNTNSKLLDNGTDRIEYVRSQLDLYRYRDNSNVAKSLY